MTTARALETRRGPVLQDGVALRELIDFNKREVAMRVLSDPEIHRLELRRVFARSWICVGHVAELPNTGDYVKRAIGADQVIVARGRDGEISVLLNACSHRGMEICWADEGNQPSFKCPYHGWVFDHAGNLMGAPFEKEMYGDWDKSQYGLRTARTTVRRGRIYANFDAGAVPLDDWLGEAAYYLDLPYEHGDPELEVLQTMRRFRIPANWKIPADNNCGDVYHGQSLHRSLVELGMTPDTEGKRGIDGVRVSTTLGHGTVGFPRAGFGPTVEVDPNDQRGPDDFIFATVMFPASFGIGGSANYRLPTVDGALVVDLGGVVPCGPDAFELWSVKLVEKTMPEPFKAAMSSSLLLDLGGVDDFSGWPSVQNASKGAIGGEQPLRYDAATGPDTKPPGWPGPGLVYTGIGKDDSQWNWWRRWYDLMTADEA